MMFLCDQLLSEYNYLKLHILKYENSIKSFIAFIYLYNMSMIINIIIY